MEDTIQNMAMIFAESPREFVKEMESHSPPPGVRNSGEEILGLVY
jgi:hypothetical protein